MGSNPRLDLGQGITVIGEVAQAHDGSLGAAHAYIDAIADSGAHAVKFQTHIAGAESTGREPWRVAFSAQDQTRFEYWRRMEFTEDQWAGLKEHADQRALLFLSSPFSLEAADLLDRIDVAAWKLASGELANVSLLDRIAGDDRPVLLSTGMSTLTEVAAAVDRLRAGRVKDLAVLQCTSRYPTPPEEVGLGLLDVYAKRFGCQVGLSDHSGTIYPSLGAVMLGARALEVHVTLSRQSFGPDVSASVTTDELRQLVEGARFLERAARPTDKEAIARDLAGVREAFSRSVVAARNLTAGTILKPDDLTLKKPGGGLSGGQLGGLLGSRVARDLAADEPLGPSDVEAVS